MEENEKSEIQSEFQKAKQKKKKRGKNKVIIFFVAFIDIYLVMVLACYGLTFFDGDKTNDGQIDFAAPVKGFNIMGKIPDRTTFLIMGTDKDGTRTDTMMFGCYNAVDNKINLISVPRDTIVTVSDETYKKMRSEFPEPGSKTMKLNAVHHFGGEKYGVDMCVAQVEKLMGEPIDYYVKVDFDAFKYIIDAVGGIEFNVPRNMVYSDPYQDLYINLKAGNQILDGDKAEQLVRYRSGYANADLGRIEVQQAFMKAFITQMLSADKIMSNPKAFLTTYFKYVDTNANVATALQYAPKVKSLSTDGIETCTLPGETGFTSGISGFDADEEEIATLMDSIMRVEESTK